MKHICTTTNNNIQFGPTLKHPQNLTFTHYNIPNSSLYMKSMMADPYKESFIYVLLVLIIHIFDDSQGLYGANPLVFVVKNWGFGYFMIVFCHGRYTLKTVSQITRSCCCCCCWEYLLLQRSHYDGQLTCLCGPYSYSLCIRESEVVLQDTVVSLTEGYYSTLYNFAQVWTLIV